MNIRTAQNPNRRILFNPNQHTKSERPNPNPKQGKPCGKEYHLESIRSMIEAHWARDELRSLGEKIGTRTCLQACFRELDENETRVWVCSKVAKGIQKRPHYSAKKFVLDFIRRTAGLPVEP